MKEQTEGTVCTFCAAHTAATVRRDLLGEPPSREHGSLYLEDKVSIAIPSQLV